MVIQLPLPLTAGDCVRTALPAAQTSHYVGEWAGRLCCACYVLH